MRRFSHSLRGYVAAWLLTRLLSPILIGMIVRVAAQDVAYYFKAINAMFAGHPVSTTLVEYPLPVLPLLELPWLLGARFEFAYLCAFVGLILLTDAMFCWLLWRECHKAGPSLAPLWWWLVFSALLSPLAYVRFDMWTAVLAAVAVLLWSSRPRIAGALVALGAGIKLWPALLWLPSLGRRDLRWRTTSGFAIAGAALALGCLAWGGWARLVSPLTWQSNRGLQVESIPATIPMLARALSPSDYQVGVSAYNAFEIFGPGVDIFMALSQVLTVVGLVAVAALLVWWWRSECRRDPLALALVAIFITLIMIVTNKTFSPQYLIWLGPLTALTILWRPIDPTARPLGRLQALLLVIAGMTTLIFPCFYDSLVFWNNSGGSTVMTALLVVRNAAVILALGLTVMALKSLHQQKSVNCR